MTNQRQHVPDGTPCMYASDLDEIADRCDVPSHYPANPMTSPAADAPGIVAFIEARLDEREARAMEALEVFAGDVLLKWLIAEVAKDRAILALHHSRGQNLLGHPVCNECTPIKEYPCQTVRLLAAIDADHPEYDPSWKPVAT